jgi:protein SCO1/2
MPGRPRSRSEARARPSRRALARLWPLLLLAGAAGAAGDAGLRAGVFDPPRAAPDFSLRGSDGAELSLGRYRGKVVILGFGFSSCPDVCPTTLSTLAQARKQLGAAGDEVQVVYVTVDPARDDAERLRSYLANFDPTFVGGTGTAEQLAAVRETYGIAASRVALGAGYGFTHSSYTYLIDREGDLRALMPYGSSPDDYAHDLSILLGP